MADSFARVLNVTIPITFDRYWSRTIGIPRIYSLDRDGLLVGSNTTTYGFDFAGAYGGSRARNAVEAQNGNTGLSWPAAVGRLSDGKTLWQLAYRSVIGAVNPLGVGTSVGTMTAISVPLGAGRQFLTCTLSPDGKTLFYVTAPAGSNNGSGTGDQWHMARWSGTAFVAVSSGTIADPWYEYKLGPGTSGHSYEAGAIESDLITIWNVVANNQSLDMFRIGADNVLRLVKRFDAGGGQAPNITTDAYPAIYADKGLCAVVSFSQLAIYTRIDLEATPAYTPPVTPFASHGLRLVQVDNGQFDLGFYDPASGDGPIVETLVYALLFTDAEAPAGREPDRYLRRGWWADPQAGSGLWHVRRQALGSAARREAIEMVRGILEAHGISKVDVQEMGAGSVSSLLLRIGGAYSGRDFVMDIAL